MFDKSVASVTGLIEACKGVDGSLALRNRRIANSE